jgi:pimeloyl-ACP methyl ester carboxylesterase
MNPLWLVVGAIAVMRAETRIDRLEIGAQALPAELSLPDGSVGLVMFAHGSGSTHRSPRNRQVAEVLQRHHLATLLFDLLTPVEATERCNVFDIALLGGRIGEALDWVGQQAELAPLRVGLFGASTGAAAALVAAAARPGRVGAVVSRGGRPDLASHCLSRVTAPTLLIVGGHDAQVLQCNRDALRLLSCDKRLEVVPGASHLFEEAGALDSVAALAADWFDRHLARRRQA